MHPVLNYDPVSYTAPCDGDGCDLDARWTAYRVNTELGASAFALCVRCECSPCPCPRCEQAARLAAA